MGLIYDEIKEIRALIEKFKNGKLKAEEAKILNKFYSETAKRSRQIIDVMKLVAKYKDVDKRAIDYLASETKGRKK